MEADFNVQSLIQTHYRESLPKITNLPRKIETKIQEPRVASNKCQLLLVHVVILCSKNGLLSVVIMSRNNYYGWLGMRNVGLIPHISAQSVAIAQVELESRPSGRCLASAR